MKKLLAVRIMLIILLSLSFFLFSSEGWTKKPKKSPKTVCATPTPLVTPVSTVDPSDGIAPIDSAKPTPVKKTFSWYFQHGPSCPHCQKLAQERQAKEEQRENLFKP